ncbi:uncharacterized protein BT62DRAFT_468349 [Guyanagaster necrorhizus]|uniref:Uncharacterized protein n=1 Tax=Guyanagaster necrorhizus TaxID=856835 RepID=A0A9P7VKY9_9AGAR|nr:uncharacterized protein BT62DRAFT_468349 [Guyanagaster necrorhizus MCA 3950]KAG7441881.1 hypothetical protein BT62DRAFT_468349 [Guyanagaster necrorhizus MCA 3950]
MKLRRRVGTVWYHRRQPRWADGCCIVVYNVRVFIATGAMVLAPLIPLATHEIRPVIGLVVWVVVYGAPEWRSFLRRLPIIIAGLAKEGQGSARRLEPLLEYMDHHSRSRVYAGAHRMDG